jgi:hypothetical protein
VSFFLQVYRCKSGKSNFEYEVLKEKRDLNGNYLALDVVIDKQKLTLLSLYGPNMDNPDFYDQIKY